MGLNRKHLIEVAGRAFPEIDQRVHDEGDAWHYCDRRGLYVHETEFTKQSGQYFHRFDEPVVVLNKFLKSSYRPWVFLHECGHDAYHSPLACNFSLDMRRKVEKEANVMASVLLMPTDMIISLTDWEIHYEYGHPLEIIQFRRRLHFELINNDK